MPRLVDRANGEAFVLLFAVAHPSQRDMDASMEVVRLKEREPFGIGGRRLCFTHPDDAGKCIKVLRSDNRRTLRGERSTAYFSRFRAEYDNNKHERQVLGRLYARLGSEMRRHFPRCYGTIPTDLGNGLLLDLMRDHDGRISRSIRELISTGTPPSALKSAFDEFSRFLLEHRIQTRKLLDHNLVARNNGDGTWTMYLVDGFGDPAWLPIGAWLPPIALRRVRRRIELVWPQVEQLAMAGGVPPEVVRQSSWGQGFLLHRDANVPLSKSA